MIEITLGIIVATLLGTCIILARRLYQKELTIQRLHAEITHATTLGSEKIALMQTHEQQLKDTFQAMATQALSSNTQQFLTLARESFEKMHTVTQEDLKTRQKAIQDIVTPIGTTLQSVSEKMTELETARQSAYEVLRQQIGELNQTHRQLQRETHNLVHALKTPNVRGQWGEMQLRRVVEMAGMLAHCDFVEQTQAEGADARLRPDMIVNLPGGKKIIVDAKAPLAAYLELLETTDEVKRKQKLLDHARQIRQHIRTLSQRSYWEQFSDSPEFVILFLPGENFFSAALEVDPELIEVGVKERVILATPTTLIAMLRAVAFGWRQEAMADNARKISALGQELYKRLNDMLDHVGRLGRSLGSAVEAYNKTVGSMESRVLVSARKFAELEVSQDEALSDISQIEQQPRSVAGTGG